MFSKITSFDQVQLTKAKVLILCDIDDTLIHYPNCDKECIKILQEIGEFNHKEIENLQLENLHKMYKNVKDPSPTDLTGFVSLVSKIKEKNNEIMLLTARSAEGDQYTRKQLTKVGINCDNLKIHYTNNMITKGEYIKSNIDISKYDEVICIDDYELYIMSILKVCPQIKCYLFKAQNI